MEEQPPKNARERLIRSIMDLGNKAFNPDATEQARAQGKQEFDEFIQRQAKGFEPRCLPGACNILIRPGHVPPWLRSKLMEILTLMPLRPDGVRATLEFVFSAHPTSTVRVSEAAVPQKKGANITQEALELGSRLISTPPASVTPEAWYSGVGPQLLALLDGGEGPELMKAASYVIGFGILGRKASGGPGTAGRKYLADPMINRIKPPLEALNNISNSEDDGIVDLSREKTLVPPDDLNMALHRLYSLVVSHPNPGLCKRLLSPLLLPLWALGSWHGSKSDVTSKVRELALELLKIFLKLVPSSATLLLLIHNIGYKGGHSKQHPEWVYAETSQGELQVVQLKQSRADITSEVPLDEIDDKIPKILDIITSCFSDPELSTAFIDLLGRWLKLSQKPKPDTILIKQEDNNQADPADQITELKLLSAMMDKFADKLATQPKHILELVSQVLPSPDTTLADEDATSVCLSLLNMIITAPGFRKSLLPSSLLSPIETALQNLKHHPTPTIAHTANSLSLLLLYNDELNPQPPKTTPQTDRQAEDRKTYSLAISYITQPDSPPPVKFEGLNLLSSLITSRSPILDIPGILVLLSSLITSSEDYINLQIIKLYTLLAASHPSSVTTELLDHYIDPRETATIDTRLRFGEALLQVIERLGEAFTGDVGQRVGNALISIAGRRGHRPKTEARQIREAKTREMKKREAEEAWDGEVPDFSDNVSEEDRLRNEILEKIVEGWEGKQGAEDVRVRASALSILGNVMETNLAGLGPTVSERAVEVAVAVLTMEREVERGILRRAAVLVVLSFVKALDKAKREGRKLGFGFGIKAREDVGRALGYVCETDVDGLVREHARDVLESLENWDMAGLVPEVAEATGLERLVGLEVHSGLGGLSGKGARPKIEEIE
ncbi:hypothetical protein OQA88_12274 [Cercophora sp. LCS_1]